MITINQVNKCFGKIKALNDLNIHVQTGSIYGLVGTNGAGKTTIINHIAGVLKADSGTVAIDGQPVYNNPEIKDRVGYIPDDLSFFTAFCLKDLAHFWRKIYSNWNEDRYLQMVKAFRLDPNRRIAHFSKGMQKQAAFLATMSTLPDYLILDEPIDGLDPIIRRSVWQYIVDDVAEREMTVFISSHNLRELEGVCDCIGILSHGSIKIEQDLDDLKSDIHKVQVAYKDPADRPYEKLNILHRESQGSIDLLIIRNKRDFIQEVISMSHPAIFDILPLTLEEIFIYELGGTDNEDILL